MRRPGMQFVLLLMCGAIALASGPQKERKDRDDSEQSKAVVKQVFEEVVNRGNFELVNQLYDPNCIIHQEDQKMTVSEAVADAKQWRSAGPDIKMTINSLEVQGDHIAVLWTAHATNTGEGHGLTASGKPIVMHGRSIFRFAKGRIAEEWNHFNLREIFEQAGQTSPKKDKDKDKD